MIVTISPLVKEAPTQGWQSTALFLAGSSVGGMVLFTSVGATGGLIQLGFLGFLAACGTALCALLLFIRELRIWKFPLPMQSRTMPRSWWSRFGPNAGALLYGAMLGVAIATIIPLASFYVALALVFLAGSAKLGSLVGLCYGLARALPVLATSVAVCSLSRNSSSHPRAAISAIADGIVGYESGLRRMNALGSAVGAGAVVAYTLQMIV